MQQEQHPAERSTPPIRLVPGLIHGVKQWSLAPGTLPGESLLTSQQLQIPWSRRRPMAACCEVEGHDHDPPEPDCTCGIYAWHADRYAETREARTFGRRQRHGSRGDNNLILGLIAGWGEVEVHERGFRCRQALPVALCAGRGWGEKRRREAERVADAYSCELIVGDGPMHALRRAARRYPGLGPDLVEQLLCEPPASLELNEWSRVWTPRGSGRELVGTGWCLRREDPPAPYLAEQETHTLGARMIRVAGTTHRRQALQSERFAPGEELRLLPEPTNGADPGAIGIWDARLELQAGYVPATLNREVGRRLASGAINSVRCAWQWRDPWDGQRIGLHVLLARHREIELKSG